MFIEEIGKELSGRMLDIWRGHTDDGTPIDMPAEKQEAYRELWRVQAKGVQPSAAKKREPRKIERNRPTGGCGCRGKKSG